MPNKILPEMAEVTRLTGAGKLAEATALIQHLLRGKEASEPAGGAGSTIIDVEAVTIEESAPQPAGSEYGGSGQAGTGQAGAGHAKAESGFAGWPQAKVGVGLGETLRNLAARLAEGGLDAGPNGLLRPAPDPLPDGAAFLAENHTDTAGTRAYKLYVPANRNGQALPLIVMMHGCTQSPDDFAAGTRMNALAEEHGFFVAYPMQPSSANAQKCWNWFNPDDQRRDEGEPSLIAGITRRIMRDHPVDPKRVYIAGLSAGGAAAAIMGTAYPDLYAAIGVHSGLPAGAARDLPSAIAAMQQGGTGDGPGNGQPVRAVPTIIFHGDQDKVVHPRNGDAVVAQVTASANGLRSTTQRGQTPGGHAYSRSIHTDPSGHAVCEQWTIHGAGHAWAGGSPSGSYTDQRGPDATREMVRFFLER